MAIELDRLEKDSTALERHILVEAFKPFNTVTDKTSYQTLNVLLKADPLRIVPLVVRINQELTSLGFQGRVKTQDVTFTDVVWYLQTSLNRDMLRSICLCKLLESENKTLWESFKADMAEILKTQDLAYYCRYLEQGKENLADHVQQKAARYVL